MSGTATNRTAIALPFELSTEILQKTQDESAIMRLAQQIQLPGSGVEIPVITGDVEAAWVAETAAKPVSNPTVTQKYMSAYKLAVIVPFSNEFRRDLTQLYNALVARLPRTLAAKFDATVMGVGSKPGTNFDNFASTEAEEITTDAYGAFVAAEAEIAENGGNLNGFAFAPAGKAQILGAVDKNDRPLFINNVAEGAVPMILGAPVYYNKGVADAAHNVVGLAGDFTQAYYGTVEGIKVDIADQATLVVDKDTTINLFQQNMFAVRAEVELGFIADTNCFVRFTATEASE